MNLSRRTAIALTIGAIAIGAALFTLGLRLGVDEVEPKVLASPVPHSVAATVTDCGRFELDIRAIHDGDQQEGPQVACMRRALRSKEPATVWVNSTTTEGGPIQEIYWLHEDGHVALTHDARLDSFGSRTIDTQRCVTPIWLPGATCRPERPNGP